MLEGGGITGPEEVGELSKGRVTNDVRCGNASVECIVACVVVGMQLRCWLFRENNNAGGGNGATTKTRTGLHGCVVHHEDLE